MLNYECINDLIGARVFNRHRMHLSDSWRYCGSVIGIDDGVNPTIRAKFDGLEFDSILCLSDLEFEKDVKA